MTPQDIEKLKALCEKEGFELDFISRSTQGAMDIFRVEKKEGPIKANITSFTLSNPYSTIVFTTSHRIKDGQVDVKEFMNHIEESIEAFLNRKP